MESRQTLSKAERLHSRKLITELFGGGKSRSMSMFPLRMVYAPVETDVNQILVSVPKRCLRRANKRNRVKRQVREAYRRHKGLVTEKAFIIAFIWLDSKLWPSDKVEQSVVSLLMRMAEKTSEDREADGEVANGDMDKAGL